MQPQQHRREEESKELKSISSRKSITGCEARKGTCKEKSVHGVFPSYHSKWSAKESLLCVKTLLSFQKCTQTLCIASAVCTWGRGDAPLPLTSTGPVVSEDSHSSDG